MNNKLNKCLLLLCLFLSACQSSDQELKTEFFDDGTKKLEYFLKNGKKHGEVKRYTNKGTLSSVYMFKDGVQDGKTIHYDYEGNVVEVQYFSSGKNRRRFALFI